MLRREYFCRVKIVLRIELYGRNKILAINGFALPVLTYSLVSFIRGPRTCSSLIDGPGNFSLCTVSTILQQTLTGCTLGAPRAVEGYDRSSRGISLVLWGWTVTIVTAVISSCKWYRSVMLGGPLIQSNAWPVSLLHSCRGVSLRTTSRRASRKWDHPVWKWDHPVWWCLRASTSDRCETFSYVQRFSLCTVLNLS